MVEVLTLSCRIQTPAGWLEVEDPDNGFSLHADTRNETAKTRRTQEVKGDWVPGSFANRSVPDNIVETLAIWVEGATTFEFRTRMKQLEAAFDQLAWSVEFTIGDSKETWTISMPADYRIVTQREFWHATTGYITAQVARQPKILLEQVT